MRAASKASATRPPMTPPTIAPVCEGDASLSLAPVGAAPAPPDDEVVVVVGEGPKLELELDEGDCKHDSSLELRTLNAFEVTLSVSIHA